jgi:hypothetical protein
MELIFVNYAPKPSFMGLGCCGGFIRETYPNLEAFMVILKIFNFHRNFALANRSTWRYYGNYISTALIAGG